MPAFEMPLSIASQAGGAAAALATGGMALLLWALAAQAPGILLRRLSARSSSLPRLMATLAWPQTGRILNAVYAVGFLAIALKGGYLEPLPLGLLAPEWGELAGWLPAVAGLTAIWAAALWGAHWWEARPVADASPRVAYGTRLGLPLHLLGEEAWAAILRGALTPALGLYWGAWAAALARTLATWLCPAAQSRMRDSAARPFTYLDWAMEWAAAGAFAVSGSLWASLTVRAAGHIAVNLVHWGTLAWARRRREVLAKSP